MIINVQQHIEVPKGDYCVNYEQGVYCSWRHDEYAQGCWVWRDSECIINDEGNQLKCAECLSLSRISQKGKKTYSGLTGSRREPLIFKNEM